jgi:hypothetical protein
MMIKGGIRIGGLGISGYDADAAAYFDRAGVTDTTAKIQINAFVKGMKNLSLYNNMVSWPLLSSQNKGSGTTAYSLGGLGIYDGTLVNGPTWGTGGITFDGTNDYINSNFNPFSAGLNAGSHFLGVVTLANPSAAGYSQLIGNEAASNFDDGTGLSRIGSSGLTFYFVGNELGSNSSTIQTIVGMSGAQRQNASQNQFIRNGQEIATSNDTLGRFANNNYFIGAGNSNGTPSYFSEVTLAFAFVFSTSLSTGNLSSFYSLYKTTMGSGLGLP